MLYPTCPAGRLRLSSVTMAEPEVPAELDESERATTRLIPAWYPAGCRCRPASSRPSAATFAADAEASRTDGRPSEATLADGKATLPLLPVRSILYIAQVGFYSIQSRIIFNQLNIRIDCHFFLKAWVIEEDKVVESLACWPACRAVLEAIEEFRSPVCGCR